MKLLHYLIFICLLIVGCEKSDPMSPLPVPKPPLFSGNWSELSSAISFSIVEKDNKLYGTCVIGEIAMAANGDQHYPLVSLQMEKRGYYPASFSGKFVHPDTISGVMNGSGFVEANYTFTRQ